MHSRLAISTLLVSLFAVSCGGDSGATTTIHMTPHGRPILESEVAGADLIAHVDVDAIEPLPRSSSLVGYPVDVYEVDLAGAEIEAITDQISPIPESLVMVRDPESFTELLGMLGDESRVVLMLNHVRPLPEGHAFGHALRLSPAGELAGVEDSLDPGPEIEAFTRVRRQLGLGLMEGLALLGQAARGLDTGPEAEALLEAVRESE